MKVGFLNQKGGVGKTTLADNVADALSEYSIPVLNSAVCQRLILVESAAQGQTVLETAPESPAADEIRQLVREIEEFLS